MANDRDRDRLGRRRIAARRRAHARGARSRRRVLLHACAVPRRPCAVAGSPSCRSAPRPTTRPRWRTRAVGFAHVVSHAVGGDRADAAPALRRAACVDRRQYGARRHAVAFSARFMQELHGTPYVSVQVSPSTLLSAHAPPTHPRLTIPARWPLPVKAALMTLIERQVLDRACGPALNAVRARAPARACWAAGCIRPMACCACFPAGSRRRSRTGRRIICKAASRCSTILRPRRRCGTRCVSRGR